MYIIDCTPFRQFLNLSGAVLLTVLKYLPHFLFSENDDCGSYFINLIYPCLEICGFVLIQQALFHDPSLIL